MELEVDFAEGAFRHGYETEDFFEVLNNQPVKLRSRRGLDGIYELYGRQRRWGLLARRLSKDCRKRATDDDKRAEDVSETTMRPSKPAGKNIRIPKKNAGYAELDDFFDRHDGSDLLRQGLTAVDPDSSDLDRMLLRYWKEPNTKQLNIRIPATAKRMIERLAKRKTVEVSTLVRMWVIDSMRREAMTR